MGSWVGFGPIWIADSNSTWKTTSDDGFRSVFLSIFENLVIWQFGYPAFYQKISIKSTFEPITTPQKWFMADAACKVSMIFFNMAPVWAENCKMDCQNTEFYSRVLLFKNFDKSLPGGPPGPPGPPRGGRTKKKKKIKVSRALDTKGAWE
jgi:hypothetical protein